jgi:hypothetical protein
MAWVAVGTAVVGGAVSAYGAKQASKAGKGGEAPKAVDIFAKEKTGTDKGTNLVGRQATGLLNYYDENTGKFLDLSERFGPQFMGQMFKQTGQFLGGVNGQPGFNALQLSSAQQAGKTLAQIRAEELGQMTQQAGLTRGLMQQLSPEQAGVVQGFDDEAKRAFASAQRISPQEQRGYQQTAREAASAAGRLGGNAAIASEVMGREDMFAQKRAEAARAGMNAYETAQGFYTQPGLQALSQAPLSYNAGGRDLALGLQLGPQSSGEFDYNMPINLAMTQAGAGNQANMANYSINAANQQAKASAYGSIGSSLMGMGLGAMGGGGGGGGFSAPGTMTAGNMAAYAGNYGRSMTGQPLRAYTV